MAEFGILLYTPSNPARGEPARARFGEAGLEINGSLIDVPLEQIGVSLGGFDHRQVFLFWHSEHDRAEGRYAISPATPADLDILLAGAPPVLAGMLAHARKDISRQGHRSRLGLGVLGFVLVLPLILLALLVWQSHAIAGWAARHIPLETEQQLGELAFKQATAGLKLRQNGADAAAIQAIGQQLTRGSAYHYHWYIAEDPAINAFAVPGGYVVVNTGLIQAADSAEEVAGVLAHEVQHVERRHTLQNLLHSLGLRAVLSAVIGDVSGSAIGSAAANLGELKFSRDLESDADIHGLQALKQAGIAPQGMVKFFEKLQQQEQGVAPPALLSTHPASADRMRTLEKLIREQGAWPSAPLPYDWNAIKAAEKTAG